MERFSINIDNAVKARLYELCRLCGMDNANKIKILDQDSWLYAEGEIELRKKIYECVGVQVVKNDRMPQQICSLCCDKINDFYEFREMCAATNEQTRKLLRLPDKPKINAFKSPPIEEEDEDDNVESIFGVMGGDEPDVKFDTKLALPKKTKKGVATATTTKKGARSTGRPPGSGKVKKEMIGDGSDAEYSIIISDEETDWVPNNNKRNRKRKGGESNNQTLLLAPKELNDRERQREMEQKKCEKKNKKRKGDGKSSVIADKRVKTETDFSCEICYENFDTSKLRHAHYAKKHLAQTGTYGCSSCIEQHADEEENRLHHENIHKKKRVAYTCPVCSSSIAYSLTKFNNHVASCVHPYFSTVDVVDNITCAKCRCEFVTKNLFDWHGCFIANKRPCPKCNRVFVKKATLWRHIFACDAIPAVKSEQSAASHMVEIPNLDISTEARRPKKSLVPPIKIHMITKAKGGRPKKSPAAPKKSTSVSFKAEPETILDTPADVSEDVFDPVKELEKILGEPSETAEIRHSAIQSPVGSNCNDGDLFGFDVVETHFGDDADSDTEQGVMGFAGGSITTANLPACTVNLEMVDFNEFPSITINNVESLAAEGNGLEEEEEEAGAVDNDGAFDEGTHHDDDYEEEQTFEAIAPDADSQIASVSGENVAEKATDAAPEPSTSKAAEGRQPITMRIKREVMHPGYGDAVFNPALARNIKREKSSRSSPVQRPNARKSTAKPTYTIVHSNPNTAPGHTQLFDAVLARNIKREKGGTNQPDGASKSSPAMVSMPVAQPSGENILGGLFDPVLARNIKKEKGHDVTRITARKSTTKPAHTATTSTPAFDPVLARNIKSEKGTALPPTTQQQTVEGASTSNAIPVAGVSNAAIESNTPIFDPALARNIKREKDVDMQPKATLRPNPLAVASTMADKPTKVSKKMYKMALLAEKIRQERLAREALERGTLSTEETSNSSTSSQNPITQNHSSINDDTSSSGNSTLLPILANVMDANNLEPLPIAEQLPELAALIPFKPIRLSTDFRKLESSPSSSTEVIRQTAPAELSQPTTSAETAKDHTSKPEAPFTISKVVSLTSIDESQPLDEAIEAQSENVECDNGREESINEANTQAQDDELNEQFSDETNQKMPETVDPEPAKIDSPVPNEWAASDSVIGGIVAKANDIQENSDINGNGHNSDARTQETQEEETDFHSAMSADKNTIMASLEAIEQIVTELEKSDAAEESTVNADPADDQVNALSPTDTLDANNESDRIAQAEIESNQKQQNLPQIIDATTLDGVSENEDTDGDIASDVCLQMDTQTHSVEQYNENVEKTTPNRHKEMLDATQAIQNAPITDVMELDDISEDSLGL